MKGMSYADAGVNIGVEEKAVSNILSAVGYKNDKVGLGGHKLVLCTDGVGSKVIIANEMRKWDTVGIDCIAMNVNDALCMGARPLAFVDYLAMEKTDPVMAEEIGKGLKKGADISGIPIIGGETATLPEIITGFDLAGTCVGVVETELPKKILPGDIIIGLRSSGLHSNGYTLARKIFTENGYSYHDTFPGMDGKIGDILLIPTQIYVGEILELMKSVDVKGIAHITGSGLRKMKRMSLDVLFSIDEPFEPQKIFKVMQELGNISDEEMYQTFNMGMGMAIVVSLNDANNALAILKKNSEMEAKIVGKVKKGKGVEVPSLRVEY
ncbi:MAG: phosphoribosylformylglycinamidine cyclo-ligase [Candidatus Thermoplasmatota archaeon]|nr:phosphoribosylformylglycinamidine cyclo-ligase [Candidatus Thermoplasmatota archaeon]